MGFKMIILSVVLAAGVLVLSYAYLNRGLPQPITPATFTCWQEQDGHFLEGPLPVATIYGVGLAYARHINETASDFDIRTGPPIFQKAASSVTFDQSVVAIPSAQDLLTAVERFEPGISASVQNEVGELLPLLDYEAELGFVLLEDIADADLNRPDFAPPVGFFIANDLSARSIAVLGEGQAARIDYWGVSKSFPGFAPFSARIWVPDTPVVDGIPCVTLQTQVNGVLRQDEMTNNLIYSPVDMLRFIRKRYPETALRQGDRVLTGTPGGVIFHVPRWKARIAELLRLNRFQKLAAAQRQSSARLFLQADDRILVSGAWLGSVEITLR